MGVTNDQQPQGLAEAIAEALWRPVAGYEGRYEVSDTGSVRSIFRKAPYVLKPVRTGRPDLQYPSVWLRTGDARPARNVRIHRLVAQAFISDIPPGMQVRHLDGDRFNNHVSNLAIGTQADNERDKIALGRSPRGDQRSGQTHLTVPDVQAIRASGAPTRLLAAEYGVSTSTIRRIRSRRYWNYVPDIARDALEGGES